MISFDVPNAPDDYVHRIGRTARAEAKGDAFVLVSPAEEKSLVQIERQIGQRLPRVTLPDFDYRQPNNSPKQQPRGEANQTQQRRRHEGNRAGGPQHLHGQPRRR